jgi:hypothetical protein
MAPFETDAEEKRVERLVQAQQIIDELKCRWDFAILGMDMNDLPISEYLI